MQEVIVDAFGGDYSPEEIISGAILALNSFENFAVVLVGDEGKISSLLEGYKFDSSRLRILNATEIITNNESPTVAIRTKKDSTIVRAFDELRTNDNVVGLVSAGSTGAVLTGAFLKLGRIKGVSRPGNCPILPTHNNGHVAIIDSGANIDCKPINLIHFAIMADAYMKGVYGIEHPRIGLLNVGTEEHKGNEFTAEVYSKLSSLKELNFVGNMEARDLFSNNYDIVVCDGFNGNVLLKSAEGAVKFVLKNIKEEIKKSAIRKIGALFLRKTFKTLKQKMDYNKYGGAIMLGCKKLVVKCHGSSKADSICCAIKQIIDANNVHLCEIIEKNVGNFGEIDG